MEKRRVVITGMGVVAPNGIGVESFWDCLVHEGSAVRRITHFDAPSYPCQIAAEVPDFDPTDDMDPKLIHSPIISFQMISLFYTFLVPF